MKPVRLIFIALLACYVYCIGFASLLFFRSSGGRTTWAGWYVLLIFLLGVLSGFSLSLLAGTILSNRGRPRTSKFVTYGLLISLLYFIFCIAYPGT